MDACPRNQLYRTPPAPKTSRLLRGGFVVSGDRQLHHACDVADQLDLVALIPRTEGVTLAAWLTYGARTLAHNVLAALLRAHVIWGRLGS